MIEIRLISAVLSLSVLVLVLDLARRGKLTFKYAAGWLILSALGMVLSVFNHLLFGMARAFGFVLPSNFIFFSLICFFIFLSLFLTIFLCQQNNRNDTMAQKIGLLELEISKLKEKKRDPEGVS